MAADVVSLGAALVAMKIATSPDRTGRRSYGSYRAEVFASGLTVLIMLDVSGYVVLEALLRIGKDVEVPTASMLVVGVIGLAINVVSILLLRSGSKESLDVKGAYFEVVSDAAGSIGVIAAGVVILLTGSPLWDTIVALAIGIFVAVRAVILGRQVLAVLGQHVPQGVDLDAVVRDREALSGVEGVHDIHIWNLTSGMNVATAHLVVSSPGQGQTVLTSAQSLLQRQHHIEHATLQVAPRAARRCAARLVVGRSDCRPRHGGARTPGGHRSQAGGRALACRVPFTQGEEEQDDDDQPVAGSRAYGSSRTRWACASTGAPKPS